MTTGNQRMVLTEASKMKRFLLLFFILHTHLVADAEFITSQETPVKKLGLTTITKEQINDCKKEILLYLAKNKRHRYLAQGAFMFSCAALLAGAYYYMYRTQAPIPPSLNDVKSQLDTIAKQQSFLVSRASEMSQAEQTLQEHIRRAGLTESAKKSSSLLHSLKNGAFVIAYGAYDFGKNIVDFFVKNGPLTIASGIATTLVIRELPTFSSIAHKAFTDYVVNPMNKIRHPIDSVWFIKYIPFETTMQHLKTTITESESVSLTNKNEKQDYIICLTNDLNLFVKQCCRLIAFLEIQSDTLTKESRTSGIHLKNISLQAFKAVEAFMHDAADAIEEEKIAALSLRFTQFEQQVFRILRHYRLYERAVLEDLLPTEKE